MSDHEWSDDNDDGINDTFVDHNDDDEDNDPNEIIMNDISNKSSETMKSFYKVRKFLFIIKIKCKFINFQINYQEYKFQLKFFARLFGCYIEAIVYILKYHIDKQMEQFTLEQIDFNQSFYFCKKDFHVNIIYSKKSSIFF